MNWKPVIFLGVVASLTGAIWWFVARQKNLISKYSASLIDIHIVSLTQSLITVACTIRITNPSDIEATITRTYADLYINGTYVGYINSLTPSVIPAKGTNDVALQLTAAPKELLKDLVGIVLSAIAQKDVAYQLKGYVTIGSGGILSDSVPFDYSGNLKQDLT